jgi:hypothetical protein
MRSCIVGNFIEPNKEPNLQGYLLGLTYFFIIGASAVKLNNFCIIPTMNILSN